MAENSGILVQSLYLIVSFNGELMEIIGLSLYVSLSALLIAALIGLPIGSLLATKNFFGSKILNIIINAFMGLPPVVAGLMVYMILSRSGPLGLLGLLYTPQAMIIAQTLLIFPILTALSRQIIEEMNNEYDELLMSLKVSAWTRIKTLLWESRVSLLTVLLAGFGRAIAEVGAVMIVGGNIEHSTRTMTTSIQMEISKGNLELAMALGIILLVISLAVNILMHFIKSHYQKTQGNFRDE
ncbi:MAG: ABC transporter permease [Kordiimonadaceae bacterium]|jgi:tungstate transport system permease protein|nr:ABC transporter permease [Kordiimonadaceae bacterium]MBT6033573.1 ABC transporter permease [Kordiimonadaceae bacterium]MBT6329876.1 ABC transporter permease [Kordiimonadaceae bacterium]MBT7581384.1 ABC transporter permease [Kordiimonadaceae bacterium]